MTVLYPYRLPRTLTLFMRCLDEERRRGDIKLKITNKFKGRVSVRGSDEGDESQLAVRIEIGKKKLSNLCCLENIIFNSLCERTQLRQVGVPLFLVL